MKEDVYIPTRDALLFQQLDDRVASALMRENAYWNSTWLRMKAIEHRCHDAGYQTEVEL